MPLLSLLLVPAFGAIIGVIIYCRRKQSTQDYNFYDWKSLSIILHTCMNKFIHIGDSTSSRLFSGTLTKVTTKAQNENERKHNGPSIYYVHKDGEEIRLRWKRVDGEGSVSCRRPHKQLEPTAVILSFSHAI